MLVLKSQGVKPRPISELLIKVGSIRCYVSSCRAVLLPRFGGPEVLELRPDVPVPDLKPNEVLVRARAVSINPLDTRVSSFFWVNCFLFNVTQSFFFFFFVLDFSSGLFGS